MSGRYRGIGHVGSSLIALIILISGLILMTTGLGFNRPALSQSQPQKPVNQSTTNHMEPPGQSRANSQSNVVATESEDQGTGIPLMLLRSEPASSASWNGAEIRFEFDQTLSATAVNSLELTPALSGEKRVQDATLIFTPDSPPEAGIRYQVSIVAGMEAANGAKLAEPIFLALVSTAPPRVTGSQPANGTNEVSVDSQIIVIFNRPIVPLVSVDDQDQLPHPLTIEPSISGQGQWINTSIYAFQPDAGLSGATEYRVAVASLASADGSGDSVPYEFRFETAAPIVLRAFPSGPLVRPDRAILVGFSQPMDPTSTEQAFSVAPIDSTTASPSAIKGTITWDKSYETLHFTPTLSSAQTEGARQYPLQFGRAYTIRVDDTALSAGKLGRLRNAHESNFTVVPVPAIRRTSPTANATNVSPDFSVYVKFNTTVSRTLLLEGITVTPVLSTTRVYSYYAEYSNELQLSWFKEPNTTYTVTVAANVADEYGNELGEDYIFAFTTGDYAPFVRLETERFTHFGAYSTTYISALHRNVDELAVDLYRLPESEFLRLSGSNMWSVWNAYQVPEPTANRIWTRVFETDGDPNVTIRQPISLTTSGGGPLSPGIYFVDIRRPSNIDADAFSDSTQAVIVLSNNNLILKKGRRDDSLVWLTNLVTGAPVDDQPVRFFADGDLIGEAITDKSGRATARLSLDRDMRWIPVIAMVGIPGESEYSVVSSEWSQGIAPWDFELSGGWLTVEDITSYLYTDRPIYRPGQTIHWKGIIRGYERGEFVLPPNDLPISVTVRDPRGDVLAEAQLTPDEHGVVSGEFQLATEALTGYYFLETRVSVGEGHFEYGGASVQVAAYRKPEFEISTTSERESYIQGDTIQITVDAGYFSGGPLPDAPVTWRLIADPYFFSWESGPDDRFYSFAPFDPDQGIYQPYTGNNLGLIQEGAGKTDKNGVFRLELPADLLDSRQSQLWNIDFTVQSSTNQFVSDRISLPIHRADYYVGLSPRAYVSYLGDDTRIDLVTITPDGDAYSGAELDVVVYEFQWSNVYEKSADGSYRWNSSVQRTPIFTTTATTDRRGFGDIVWQPETGGQYQIVATGHDEQGHETSSTTFVWVSTRDPDKYISWPRANNDRIELVSDKRLYAPGDTAEILVPSPFSGPVYALVTIERGGVIESNVLQLEGNSEVIELPIDSRHIPNIYVSVTLVKGVDETNPIPAMRVGYTHLVVDTGEKQLSLDISASAAQVAPSSTVTYAMTIVDHAGVAVPNANVSVALIDKAIYSLAQGDMRSMMEVFYYQRTLEVSTGILLVINRERSSQQLSEGAKGGGGGDGGGGLQLREDFPDIAYWRASLISDEDGRIEFSVKLPDNLTTWTLAARAVTNDTRVGDAQLETVATKSLQVRPLTPRFLTAGDRVQIGAALVNASASAIEDAMLTIDVTGGKIAGESTVHFAELDSQAQAVQTWNVEVDQDVSDITVTFRALAQASPDQTSGRNQMQEFNDAVRLQIPVVRYESPETVSTAGTVGPDGITEVIYLPGEATDNGELVVTIEPGLAAGMVEGLTYLREYTYACTEQTVSRFLPNLFTVRALRSLNIDNDPLENALNFHLGIGVQRLVNLQNQDGGWGYWPGERSSIFVSAYALWGLASAIQMEYPVPDHTLDDAIAYLERNYQAPSNMQADWELNEMAFVHYILSQLSEGDPGRASTLYDQRERLAHYGKALLAMALDNMNDTGDEDPRVQTLLDDLFAAANISATGISWQEESIDYRTLNTNTRSTSIILTAFLQIEPEQSLLSQVVRWLMETRKAGRWNTTQETAWAIISLTDFMVSTDELDADYKWNVNLNQVEIGEGRVLPSALNDNVALHRDIADLVRDQANILQISRDSNQGQMYYTTDLNYFLDATAIAARERGIFLDRSFRVPDRKSTTSASVGDIISVTTTIIAPNDLYQLLVEVPIPAGTEPIDPNIDINDPGFGNPEFAALSEESAADYRWGYWQPTYMDMRDDKLAFFVTYLPAGTYEYTFNVRATIPGEYRVLPVYAEQMYFNEVWGRSAGALFSISK